MLLFSARYRYELEGALRSSDRAFFYSAFFTVDGGHWLSRHRKYSTNDRLLIRGLPADFLAGACSFDAIKSVMEQGLQVRMSSALHAKIYAFDEFVFAGSANLTAKGLALSEDANIEIGVKANLSHEDIASLERLWSQGVSIDEETLAGMRAYINSFTATSTTHYSLSTLNWPDDVIEEVRDLYCSDFPASFPSQDLRWVDEVSLKQTLAYKWLASQVADSEVSFGFLSEQLHAAVCDDPVPYRSEIKKILTNLLLAVQQFDNETFEVVRPQYRQIVRKRF